MEVNIVILDRLDFSPEYIGQLERLGNVVVYDDYPEAEGVVVERLRDADVAIVGWTTLTSDTLRRLPRLKYIALALTGYEVVDLDVANECGIMVSNVPDYSRQSVAEYAFALALAVSRHIALVDKEARAGNLLSPTQQMLGNELYQKTLGVLGLGSIGSWVAKIGLGFGMKVIGHSRSAKHIEGVADVSIDQLVRESDLLVIAVDTNSTTVNILSSERLRSMKRGAILINITSNQVLDEEVVAELLNSHHLAGAGFDDLSHSGHDDHADGAASPLLEIDSAILSPQAGWYTREAEERLLQLVVENVRNFANGSPSNLVGA